MVELVRNGIGSRSKLIHVPPQMALLLSRTTSYLLRDVVLTRDELRGIMDSLLIGEGSPAGATSSSKWMEGYGDSLGRRYESEIQRHYSR